MPGPYLDPVSGLHIPTVEETQDEIITEARATIHANADTDADGMIGQWIGIFATHLRRANEALLVAYEGADPDRANDVTLPAISWLTGTKRRGPTFSTLDGPDKSSWNLDANITIPIGSQYAANNDPTNIWQTTEEVTSTIAGNYPIAMRAVNPGPVFLAAGTLTVPIDIIPGVNSVTNPSDATIGKPLETIEQLRLRRRTELPGLGSSTTDAIYAEVLQIEVGGVQTIIAANILENDTDEVSPDGVPPHAFCIIIWDGNPPATPNDTIAQTIWNTKGGGIATHGSSSGIARNLKGQAKTVRFTRVTLVPMTILIDISTDDSYPGNDALKEALAVAAEALQSPGVLAAWSEYVAAAMAVTGVTRVGSIVLQGGTPNTDFVVGTFEQVTVDTTDITIF